MSKERLEEMKSRIKSGFGCLRHFLRDALDPNDKCVVEDIKLLESDIGYLIKQAERVQGLEKSLGSLIKQNKEMRKSAGFYNSESYNAHLERLLDKREKQIQDLIIDVAFYKTVSERYEYVEKQNKRYREAMKRAIDILKYVPSEKTPKKDAISALQNAMKGGYEW